MTQGYINIRKLKIFLLGIIGKNLNASYSPDLNPCDYDGIARIKRPNKSKRFAKEFELEMAYDQVILEINVINAATGILYLPLRCALVNQSRGEYIH